MFEFLQPVTLADAVALLRDKPNTKILAGGTDLIIGLKANPGMCEYLLDCKKIPELNELLVDGATLTVGACVTLTKLLEAELPGEYDVLKQGAGELANHLLRNRATLIGNICNASPGGDIIPACLVLGAVVEAVSASGTRQIPLGEFFTGVKKHVLRPDEIAARLIFSPSKGRGFYKKKKRIRGHDLAQVSVAAYYTDDSVLSLAFGAVGPTPVLLDLGKIEKGRLASEKEAIIEKAAAAVSPIGDVRSSKEYRLSMLRHFTGEIIDALSN